MFDYNRIEELLYIKYRIREEEKLFVINQGNNDITLDNIKTFFNLDEIALTNNKDYIKENNRRLRFDEIDWDRIMNLPDKEKCDAINELQLYRSNWGFYFLTANENGLNIKNTRMSENSYIYILDELTNETLTVEDMRKAIATMTQEEYPNLCFEDLSKSEDYDMKRYFARERCCDEMKSYLKDLQAEQSMEDIDLEK